MFLLVLYFVFFLIFLFKCRPAIVLWLLLTQYETLIELVCNVTHKLDELLLTATVFSKSMLFF